MLEHSVAFPPWSAAARSVEAANRPARTAGALHRSRVRFEVAEQQGAFWKAYVRFMGRLLLFGDTPLRRADHDSITEWFRSVLSQRDERAFSAM
jgi:hypothetical protein